jgi:hypothetical protein
MNENITPSGAPDFEDVPANPSAEEVVIDPELEAIVTLLMQAGQAVEVPAGFNGRLENQLRERAVASRKGADEGYRLFGRQVSRFSMMLAGAASMALILLLALPLLLPALSQRINPPAVTQASQAGPVSSASPRPKPTQAVLASPSAPSILAPGVQPLLTFFGSSAQAQSAAGGIFGKAQLTLSENLPASPKAVTVYEQRSDLPMTPALAKEQADKLGIQGEVYQSSSEGGGTTYIVTDGLQEVWFMQGTTHFSYVADMNNSMISRPSNLPLEKRVQAAEAFLKKAGLLDFDYRVNEALSQGRKVVFDRLFNGVPLLETDNYNPYISVEVNDDSKVDIVMVGLNPMQPLGNYPIRSAEDAWRIVLGDPNDKRVQYTVTDPAVNMPQILASWNRTYPDGKRVDITFYPNVLPSAEPGGQPWVTLGPFTLRGDLTSLLDAYNGQQELSAEQKQMIASGAVSEKQAEGWSRFLHVWGQATTDDHGARFLQVEGWERSPMPDDFFFGTLIEENTARLLAAEDGQKWSLADLPADVPLGVRISVRGVRVKGQPGVFDWSFIQVEPPPEPESTGGGGGGGGGGGLSNFSPTPGQAATEMAPPPLPYQSGDRLEGVVANLEVVEKITYGDGRTEMVYLVGLPSPTDPTAVISVKLRGDALQGLDSLIRLHVKLWGTFQVGDQIPTIQVERYEKAYPDEIYKAWLGHEKVVTLAGRQVMLFTDINGKQYVFERSIENSPVGLEDGFRGEQFVVEGTLSHETYAGYPMILESSASIAPGRTDLIGYVVQGNRVGEDYENGSTPQPPLAQDSVKNVVIDQAELVYFAYDFSHGGGYDLNTSPMRYVQPVWRFSGKLDDGRLVQVLVQAVTDEYLSEP